MAILKILAILSLVGSIGWVWALPGFDSGLAVVASLSALIALFMRERNSRAEGVQTQKVSRGSVGIQAGGNVQIGQTTGDKQ